MTSKKWLAAFFCTVALLLALMMLFNMLVDPFGVFGDAVFDWYSYDTTLNPRVAKIAYLDKHHDEYDSYIVGCSGSSSFPADRLDAYCGAKFFNMIMYGADMLDIEQTCRYLIDNYTVKNIVLSVYIDNALFYDIEPNRLTHNMHEKVSGGSRISFYGRYLMLNPQYSIAKIKSRQNDTYLPQAFDVFDMATGAYDKRARDAEPIGAMARYLEAYPVFADYPHYKPIIMQTDNCMKSVAAIRDMCGEHGVNLIVLMSPAYSGYFNGFDKKDVTAFYAKLAEITPFWDFSMSSISYDPRWFYDDTHFRNCVGAMALGRVFGDEGIYIPDDFGAFVTADSVAEHMERIYNIAEANPANYVANVPILMYHNISETVASDMDVTPGAFDAQMRALAENGYASVSLSQLVDFVDCGVPLPEKPVVVTFDDGYLGVYEYAYPILDKYSMCATAFVIGSAVGTSTYKDTGHPTFPKFSYDQAREMSDSGVISIQSHTYDMHQTQKYEAGPARENILIMAGEKESDYIAALRADHMRISGDIAAATGQPPFALAFPTGKYDTLSQAVMQSMGIRVTLSVEPGVNTIIKGMPQSLLSLKRLIIIDETDIIFRLK